VARDDSPEVATAALVALTALHGRAALTAPLLDQLVAAPAGSPERHGSRSHGCWRRDRAPDYPVRILLVAVSLAAVADGAVGAPGRVERVTAPGGSRCSCPAAGS